ncbi:MAG: hypothetical protein ABJO67_17165 [Pseudoruegeria sp.]
MKAMLTGFAAVVFVAIASSAILDTLGFDSSAVHSGPSVRLD